MAEEIVQERQSLLRTVGLGEESHGGGNVGTVGQQLLKPPEEWIVFCVSFYLPRSPPKAPSAIPVFLVSAKLLNVITSSLLELSRK